MTRVVRSRRDLVHEKLAADRHSRCGFLRMKMWLKHTVRYEKHLHVKYARIA